MELELLELSVEYIYLSKKFDISPCNDYYKEYARMDEIYWEMDEILKKIYQYEKHERQKAIVLFKDIAEDLYNGDQSISSVVSICLFGFNDIDDFLTRNMDESEKRVFEELYYFMGENDRRDYAESKLIELMNSVKNISIYTSNNLNQICLVEIE